MNAPLPAFQQFQMDFGRRIRNPRAARPAGVPVRHMAVYEELLFNNITGFLDACFPVCRRMIGDTRWRRLNRAFFRDWRCTTPLFREIPREFLSFLERTRQPLPAWFRALAHYEWVELAVDTSTAVLPPHDPQGDLLTGRPQLNPTLMRLAYDWPVHRIGPDWRPRRQQRTHLLAFRDAADVVRFVAINAATAQLVDLLAEGRLSGQAAIARLVDGRDENSVLVARVHAPALLADLHRQGIISGVRP